MQPSKSGADGTVNAETRIVTDCIGRKVEIPDHVERIACLYAFAGHVTAMLGQSDKIVAVVDGMKRDVLLTSMFPSTPECRRALYGRFDQY